MTEPAVVLITGASSGIGRATAHAFAKPGVSLVLAARSPQSLAVAAAECRTLGAEVIVVPTDVGDGAAVEALFKTAVDKFERVDVVVHAAAAVGYGLFTDVPAEVFDRAMTTNLTGTANVARTSLMHFQAVGGGSLVLVGSLLGKIAVPYMSTYVTGKWAVHGLARIIQIEARQLPGVSVSVVSPGSIDTPAYSQAANYVGREGRPPPPVDRPEKVARAIVRAARHPVRERGVGVANPLVVLGFRALPGVYDLLVTPLVKVGALSRTTVTKGPGSVLNPQPAGNAPYGKWGRHWLRSVAATGAASGLVIAARLISRSLSKQSAPGGSGELPPK